MSDAPDLDDDLPTDAPQPVPSTCVTLEAYGVAGLPLAQAKIPLIQGLTVRNPSDALWEDVRVRLAAEPAFAEHWEVRLERLDPYRAQLLRPKLVLAPAFLAAQTERVEGRLVVTVEVGGEVVGRHVHEVSLTPPAHWPGVTFLPELLASWVRPNSPALPAVLRVASDRAEALTGSRALSGYQQRDPQHAWRLAQAGWEALQQRGVDYINPPASFERIGQKVRTPTQVVGDGHGTCLDLTVVLAALWEQMGLHPFLVIVDGHAFPGVWLTEYALSQPVLDDPRPLRKRIDLGEALVVDSSPVASKTTFDDARRAAERMLENLDSFVCLVDVAAARAYGVHPLPGDGEARVAGAPGPRERDLADVVGSLPQRWIADEAPVDKTAADRVDRWKARLLDLSLRNRLLNFRPGKATAPLPFCDLALLEDALAGGQEVELLARPDLRIPEGEGLEERERERLRREALREVGLAQQASGRVLVDLPPKLADTTLLGLYRSSRAAYEESGATTLYLTLGMLSWFESATSTQPRIAPLVLVPVELVRPAVGASWKLKAADEEARVNVTLLQKLREDFGLDTTGLDVLPEDDSGLDIPRILVRFRKSIKDFDRWEVFDDAWLGQFSFTKFLMWLDLEAKREALARNPVVAQLFAGSKGAEGGGPPPVPLVAEAQLDSGRPTADTVTVLDADPSQLQAILAASDGASFVLQGPPGTGKSQTITNLIARLLASGRTVLFVSEKLAALDVVQRRLEQVGLGPFCLELHSSQASKRMVAEQLKQAFAHANLQPPEQWARRVGELQALREQLNAHAARLAQLTPFGGPARDVLASLFGLRDVPRVELPALVAAGVDEARVDRCRRAARDAAVALPELGEVAEHPWRGVRETGWRPAWEREVVDALQALERSIAALQATATRALEALQWPGAADLHLAVLDELADVVRLLLDTPAPPRALLAEGGARDRLATARQQLARGRAVATEREALRAHWRDALLQLDLDTLLARHERWGGAWLVRVFTLWTARGQLKSVALGALPDEATVKDQLGTALRVRAGLVEVEGWTELARGLGPLWAGADTDWGRAEQVIGWAEGASEALLRVLADPARQATHRRLLDLMTDQADLVREGGPLRAVLAELAHAREAYDASRGVLTRLTRLDVAEAFGVDAPLAAQSAWAREALASRDRLKAWCFAAGAFAALRAEELGPVLDELLAGRVAPRQLERTVERSVREAWWDHELEADPSLATFRGLSHTDLVRRFRQLEEDVRLLAQREAAARVAARVPDLQGPGDELALLRRQLLLKRSHLPVRKLFEKIGSLLLRVKPCALMSPLSVAQYLDPSLAPFDVVVFDEASQIPPWDAIGAIARGRQAIVVGDSKQLPPTSFFSRDVEEEPEDDDLVELESVLDEAVASGLQSLRLRWHYRSRHESLIAFSNHHYYDNRLHTFPSADDKAQGVGVEFREVKDGFYDRGGSRTNRREAEEVVAELARLLSLPEGERPSVGVVTFSMAQQTLILDLVDALQAARPELVPFFNPGGHDPVFVKNLENVQGDERDVMLFSIGYGPDERGRVYLNLGPLTRQGGERRLNVAVTRARSRLVVFSTLRHDHIRTAGTSSVGVRHLRTFLHYAQEGRVALDAEVRADGQLSFESPFEEEVHTFLSEHGHQVDTQVGSSGYRIDLAVVHPDRPGAYAIAVECDGATYHGSRNARERDRLRDAVLGQLGWRVERVWSTDWWYEPAAARKRLLDAVQAAIDDDPGVARPPPPPAPVRLPAHAPVDVEAALREGPSRPTYPPDCTPWPGLPGLGGGTQEAFHEFRAVARLRADLARVVTVAGPLPREDAFRHVAQAWGWASLGKRISARCEEALKSLPVAERPVDRDGTLWPPGLSPGDWTTFHPAEDGGATRELASIPVAELANATVWVVQAGVSMSTDAAVREVAGVFGFGRLSKRVEELVRAGVEEAVRQGRVREADGRLTVG